MTYSAAMAAPAALLEAELATWRRTRRPEHAAAFEAHARRALAGWTAPPAISPRAFQRAWLTTARDIVGRGWALDTLLQHLPGDDPGQRAHALAKRIEALARHGPDPRFGAVIEKVRDAVPVPIRRLDTALLQLQAERHVDPTALRVIRELPPATPEIEGLWRDVHAHPDDDAPLTVLADALQLAGDPRGELIALQLGAVNDEPARAARRRDLIASCGAAWLGRLTQVTGAASFERGVLRRLQLSSELLASDPGWDALIGDPMLATVTELLPGNVSHAVYARFVTGDAMRSLVRVEMRGLCSPDGPSVGLPPAITHVACSALPVDHVTRALAPSNQLRSITIHASDFGELAAAPWFAQLTSVTVGVGGAVRRGFAMWSALPPTMTLTIAPSADPPAIATAFPWDFAITLARGRGATIARVSGEWLLLPVDILGDLPREVVRVEVDHRDGVMLDRIRGAIGRKGVEVVHRPIPRLAAVFTPPRETAHGG